MRFSVPVAASSPLRRLDEAADGLEDAVADIAREPAQHPVPVLADAERELLDRLKARADRPGVPALEMRRSLLG